MHRISLRAALGLIAAAWMFAAMTASPSEAANCAEMREQVARMDRESAKPPGYLVLRNTLLSQAAACRDTPPANEYWFRADGTPTGATASGPRPSDGAYSATPEVGASCASTKNPGMCALDAQVAISCRTPQPESRKVCEMLFGEGYVQGGADPGPNRRSPRPPTPVTLDGRTYALDRACTDALYDTTDAGMQANPNVRAVDLDLMKSNCPDFLAALQRRTGRDAARDPAGFWPALGDLVLGNFPPAGAPPVTVGTINADPNFRRMCEQAAANENTCRQRQGRMGAVGTISTSRALQAGDFGDCADLYGRVAQMCRNTQAAAARPPAAAPAKAAAAPPAKPAAAPPPQQSAAPQMSPQCQQLVSNYVGAAQANDGPKALAGYNALKQAGGCGVLAQVDHAPTVTPPPTSFPTRGAQRNTDGLFDDCAARNDCSDDVRALKEGTSAAAVAALWTNAISVGLQLGAAMASGLAATMPQGGGGGGSAGGGGTNYNSIGNKKVRSTYGEGSPDAKCPPGGCVGR